MSKESKFFTVKYISTIEKENGEQEFNIEVKNFTNEQWNSAVLEFNTYSTYARSLPNVIYFRVSILNEWDGIEKVDTNEGE